MKGYSVMELPGIPLLSMLRERMSWLNQRQTVLSQNVANADTPGYVAHDLKPLDFDQMLHANQSAGRLAITNPRHIAVSDAADPFDAQKTPSQEYTTGGTGVSLEAEMIKVADTQAQFQAAANLYSKAMTLMRTAIGH
jgi:flagellar basal-body rod protein FlgB